jgi:hypothetical protein
VDTKGFKWGLRLCASNACEDRYLRARCACRRGRSTKKYLRIYRPPRPRSGPPHLRQPSCWSGKVSFVSMRTSLYCAAQFGHSNGVVSVIGMRSSGLRGNSLRQRAVSCKHTHQPPRSDNVEPWAPFVLRGPQDLPVFGFTGAPRRAHVDRQRQGLADYATSTLLMGS